MIIFIAAAHGLNDPGAVANNTTERDEVIKIVDRAVESLIPALLPYHSVIKVPHNMKLADEVRFINLNSSRPSRDICIEIHMNSNRGKPGTGVEIFHGFIPLCNMLQKYLVEVTELKNRGVKFGRHLYFNRATKPRSALVELGFINNLRDLTIARGKGPAGLIKGITEFANSL